MGIDDLMDEAWERGWTGSDKFICVGCVADDHVRGLIDDAATPNEVCSFCGSPIAAPFDTLMEAFMVGVSNRYEQADNAGMPIDEGEYVFGTFDSSELPGLLDEVAGGPHDDLVNQEITECLVEKTYASRWWLALEPRKAYGYAWEQFCEQILHRTRFVFWLDAAQHDAPGAGEVPVAEILQSIGALVRRFNMIVAIPSGSWWWRARGHKAKTAAEYGAWGASDLGTNTAENCTGSTRMSPPGIPLFYGASDLDTAVAEVVHGDDESKSFTVGRFANSEPLRVLDLTSVPSVPSVFDARDGWWQGHIAFLHALVDELRKPVESWQSNLGYVPTQVFSEYFLRVFDEPSLDGLLWESTVAGGLSAAFAVCRRRANLRPM